MRTRSLSLLSYEAVAAIVVHLLYALDLAWLIVYHMHVVTSLESCSSKKNTMMEDAMVVLLRSQTVDQLASHFMKDLNNLLRTTCSRK